MAHKTQEQLVTVFETIRDRMTGAEIDMVVARFNELDTLIEGKYAIAHQIECMSEIETILTAIEQD